MGGVVEEVEMVLAGEKVLSEGEVPVVYGWWMGLLPRRSPPHFRHMAGSLSAAHKYKVA